jgi:hypothetical protein
MWPFGNRPRKRPVAEPPVDSPPPTYRRVCVKCKSELFTVHHGMIERAGALVLPMIRVRCIRCGSRMDLETWTARTVRVEGAE